MDAAVRETVHSEPIFDCSLIAFVYHSNDFAGDSVEFTEKLSSLIAQFGIDVERRDKVVHISSSDFDKMHLLQFHLNSYPVVYTQSQRTALGFAAQHNRVMAVSSLLHIGANVNARSKVSESNLRKNEELDSWIFFYFDVYLYSHLSIDLFRNRYFNCLDSTVLFSN